ncbi:hypothetical protein [Asaia sp. HN010]|uniref:hypothetical protein n=1 Tax=Asaia sp. HN010 TaxID=3081233 RepID=UPI003019A3C6
MALRTNPSLGSDLDQIISPDGMWLDVDQHVSPQYGDVSFDGDGFKRIFVTNPSDLASGAAFNIDTSGNANAASGGAFTAPSDIPAGSSFWAKASAI